MGSVLTGIFGGEDKYQASSPYEMTGGQAAATLQEALNRNSDIYGRQQALSDQLKAQAAGTGPNPSQVQYLANVGNNIANAQGLISSQRGLNPALAARLGSNVAANENQRASLGSALLQQQQQIAAQNQLSNLYNQMYQGNLGYQGLLAGGAQNAQGLNAGVAGQNAQTQGHYGSQAFGGLLNGIGGATALLSEGGKVDGKAKVKGDSESNDTVHAMLSPGEIVIPRSHAQDPEKAKYFIDHLLKSEKKSDVTYGDVLKAKRKKASK